MARRRVVGFILCFLAAGAVAVAVQAGASCAPQYGFQTPGHYLLYHLEEAKVERNVSVQERQTGRANCGLDNPFDFDGDRFAVAQGSHGTTNITLYEGTAARHLDLPGHVHGMAFYGDLLVMLKSERDGQHPDTHVVVVHDLTTGQETVRARDLVTPFGITVVTGRHIVAWSWHAEAEDEVLHVYDAIDDRMVLENRSMEGLGLPAAARFAGASDERTYLVADGREEAWFYPLVRGPPPEKGLLDPVLGAEEPKDGPVPAPYVPAFNWLAGISPDHLYHVRPTHVNKTAFVDRIAIADNSTTTYEVDLWPHWSMQVHEDRLVLERYHAGWMVAPTEIPCVDACDDAPVVVVEEDAVATLTGPGRVSILCAVVALAWSLRRSRA